MRIQISCLLFLLVSLSACATFQPEQEQYIESAMALQGQALSNPLFAEILKELEARGDTVWDNRIHKNFRTEAATFPTETDWMLSKYEAAGGLERSRLKAWRNLNPFSRTTAKYDPNTHIVRLSLQKFNNDPFALLNTFVHEKNHSFGLVHDRTQTRSNNHCDGGYLAGDLAEAIQRTANNQSDKRTPHSPYCPALCAALERRGMWSPCAETGD